MHLRVPFRAEQIIDVAPQRQLQVHTRDVTDGSTDPLPRVHRADGTKGARRML